MLAPSAFVDDGAPLPALGATLIGQAVGGGAIYAVWRKRRSRKQRQD